MCTRKSIVKIVFLYEAKNHNDLMDSFEDSFIHDFNIILRSNICILSPILLLYHCILTIHISLWKKCVWTPFLNPGQQNVLFLMFYFYQSIITAFFLFYHSNTQVYSWFPATLFGITYSTSDSYSKIVLNCLSKLE